LDDNHAARQARLLGDNHAAPQSRNYWHNGSCWPAGIAAGVPKIPYAGIHLYSLLAEPEVLIVSPGIAHLSLSISADTIET
jgi:hypothetical protein